MDYLIVAFADGEEIAVPITSQEIPYLQKKKRQVRAKFPDRKITQTFLESDSDIIDDDKDKKFIWQTEKAGKPVTVESEKYLSEPEIRKRAKQFDMNQPIKLTQYPERFDLLGRRPQGKYRFNIDVNGERQSIAIDKNYPVDAIRKNISRIKNVPLSSVRITKQIKNPTYGELVGSVREQDPRFTWEQAAQQVALNPYSIRQQLEQPGAPFKSRFTANLEDLFSLPGRTVGSLADVVTGDDPNYLSNLAQTGAGSGRGTAGSVIQETIRSPVTAATLAVGGPLWRGAGLAGLGSPLAKGVAVGGVEGLLTAGAESERAKAHQLDYSDQQMMIDLLTPAAFGAGGAVLGAGVKNMALNRIMKKYGVNQEAAQRMINEGVTRWTQKGTEGRIKGKVAKGLNQLAESIPIDKSAPSKAVAAPVGETVPGLKSVRDIIPQLKKDAAASLRPQLKQEIKPGFVNWFEGMKKGIDQLNLLREQNKISKKTYEQGVQNLKDVSDDIQEFSKIKRYPAGTVPQKEYLTFINRLEGDKMLLDPLSEVLGAPGVAGDIRYLSELAGAKQAAPQVLDLLRSRFPGVSSLKDFEGVTKALSLVPGAAEMPIHRLAIEAMRGE